MSYIPSDAVTCEFVTQNPATGAALNADSLPVGTFARNGTDDGTVTVTVTNVDAGRYKSAFTIPSGGAAGDTCTLSIAATVSAIAGKAIVWQSVLDKKRIANIIGTDNLPKITTDAQDLSASLSINTKNWAGGAIPAPNVTGVPKVDVFDWLGSTPDALSSGKIPADIKLWLTAAPAALTANGYVQSMLLRWLTDNAGGTPDALSSGKMPSDLKLWLAVAPLALSSQLVQAIVNDYASGKVPLQPTTAGRTLVVDASGLADANMVKAGPSGSGTAQTARDLGLALPAAAPQAAGGLITSAAGSLDMDDLAADVDATETRVTTALPNAAPQAAGGLITSTAGSLDMDDLATDVDAIETRVTTALPSVAPNAAGGLLITAAGSLDMDDLAADVDATETRVTTALPNAAPQSAGGLVTSIAGSLDLDEMNADVEDIQAAIGVAGAGLTAIPDSATLTEVGADVDELITTIGAAGAGLTAIPDSSVVTEIGADVDELIATVGIAGAGLTAIPDSSTLTEVGADVDELITSVGLIPTTPVLTGHFDTIMGTPVVSVSADIAEIEAETDDIASVKAKTDQFVFTVPNQVDANALTGGLDAAGVRSAVGLASANLDAQLAEIELETDDIAPIKAKTDQLAFTVANQVDANAVTGGLDAAGVRSAVGLESANLDNQLSEIEGETDGIASIPTNPLLTTDIRLNHLDADISSLATLTALSALQTEVTEIHGLTGLFSGMRDGVYAGANLVSFNIFLYDTGPHALTNDGVTGVLHKYQILNTYSGANLLTSIMTRAS